MESENEITLEEANSKLKINKHSLDVGLSDQPELFARVSYMTALSCSIRDQAKNNLSIVEAEVASTIRQEFIENGEKVTEAAIKEEIAQDIKIKKTNKDFLNAKKEADIWQGLKEAYDQRGRMLRELVHLYISGYYQRQEIKLEKGKDDEASLDYARKRLSERRRSTINKEQE